MYDKNSLAYTLFEIWRVKYEAGTPKSPSKRELDAMTAEKAHKVTVEFFKYVFSYLKINPRDISNVVSEEYLQELKLKSIFKCLQFPVEYSNKIYSYINKIDYLSRLLYPDMYSDYECSDEYRWMTEYCNCQIVKENRQKYKFTLSGEYDYDRKKIAYLFNQYIFSHPLFNGDIRLMYDYFADEKKCHTYVLHSLLNKVCNQVFDSPLEMFHYSLPESQRSEFLYQYENFKIKQKELALADA